MLSDELLEELGGEDGLLVVGSRPKSKKRSRDVAPSAELIDKHMYMSAREKRRLEQITKRKEKEERRGEFLQVLQDNEILPQHQDLLISGKELGQMHTIKNRLKKLHKRYKAGLALTDEEKELLFPSGERRANVDSNFALHSSEPADGSGGGVGGSSMAIESKDQDCTLVDFFSVCGPGAEPNAAGEVSNNKERTSKVKSSSKTAINDGSCIQPQNIDKFKIQTRVSGVQAAGAGAGAGAREGEGAVAGAEAGQRATTIAPAVLVVPPTLSKAVVASTALSLAAQLQNLKSSLKSAPHLPAGTSAIINTSNTSSSIEEIAVETSTEGHYSEPATLRRYVPQPLVMPHAYLHPLPRAKVEGSNSINSSGISSQYVAISRPADVQESRLGLPVCSMEQELVESIRQNDVVIVCGETGSGKSTQVPQFCFENGFARGGMLIGITQPRRVAAVTTADRVGYEMGDQSRPLSARLVGHQIRHENSTGPSTAIKFMTDGILLQEVEQDLLLRRYSVVIIDEAHERGLNSDVLLGMLSRAVPMRRRQFEEETALYEKLTVEERDQYMPPLPPLKLIIMSATLRVDDFTSPQLFPAGAPPVVSVDARQFPVTVHFSRHTETSHRRGAYLDICVKKVKQIHSHLPEGGILVFLTGKREIAYVVNKLRRALSRKVVSQQQDSSNTEEKMDNGSSEQGDKHNYGEWGFGEEGDSESEGSLSGDEKGNDDSDNDDEDDAVAAPNSTFASEPEPEPEPESESKQPSDEINRQVHSTVELSVRDRMLQAVVGTDPTTAPEQQDPLVAATGATLISDEPGPSPPRVVRVVPLYAMLSAGQQREVFRPVDASQERLIIVATNVAETSITIPGVRYVVDSGREKRRTLLSAGPEQGRSKVVAQYQVGWVSQASAEQRRGRAGRTGPGHCYRLYSATFFDAHMPRFSEPQIRTVPLEMLVLKLRSIGIRDVIGFPFPTPPPASALRQAVLTLQNIGATALGAYESLPNQQQQPQQQQKQKQLLTSLGKKISRFALAPRLAKVLAVAAGNALSAAQACIEDANVGKASGRRRELERDALAARELLEHALGFVSILSEKSPFMRLSGRLNTKGDGGSLEDRVVDEDEDEEKEEGGEGCKRDDALLWMHREGDALARHRAFGAYSFLRMQSQNGSRGGGGCGNTDGRASMNADTTRKIELFCSTHSLSEQSLGRAFALRQQLSRQIAQDLAPTHSADPALVVLQQEAVAAAIAPPSQAVEAALLQLLLSAHGDQLARRAPLGTVTSGSRRQRLTAYIASSPEINEALYLHPHSCLYSPDPTAPLPEWVVFSGLVRNEANTVTYMDCCAVVNANWMANALQDCPLLQLGPILESPGPLHDKQTDCVLGYSLPALGAHKWELPPIQIPLAHAATMMQPQDGFSNNSVGGSVGNVLGFRPCDIEVRWFGRLLLENKVPLSSTISFHDVFCKDAYSETPASITNCKPIPKVVNLLRALVDHGCTSRGRLLELLRKSGNVSGSSGSNIKGTKYLQEEMAAFITLDKRKDFRVKWSKLL